MKGIELTSQQAQAIYGALLMRPTIERQLEELIAHDSTWSADRPKLKAHYDHLEKIYVSYAPKGSKPWPPKFKIGAIPSQIDIFTTHGSTSVNISGG